MINTNTMNTNIDIHINSSMQDSGRPQLVVDERGLGFGVSGFGLSGLGFKG